MHIQGRRNLGEERAVATLILGLVFSVDVIYCSCVAHAWVLLAVLTCYYCCIQHDTW